MMMRRQHHQLGGWRRSRPSSIRGWRCLRIFRNRRNLLMLLAFMALAPPIFFHFRLQRFHQIAAYRAALQSGVDCIEIDVSRSSDGVLFAIHDRQGFAADIWESYGQSWLLEYTRYK
uniref:glycerophosphodiester phosphodiesterase n=1 Tax=Opuntia streptacantha TaxID=393608 RepID=A0A7C9ESP3_OPUST